MIQICPSCKADFQDKPIPDKSRENYGNLMHFTRLITVCDRDLDEAVAWRCPDCGHEERSRTAFDLATTDGLE